MKATLSTIVLPFKTWVLVCNALWLVISKWEESSDAGWSFSIFWSLQLSMSGAGEVTLHKHHEWGCKSHFLGERSLCRNLMSGVGIHSAQMWEGWGHCSSSWVHHGWGRGYQYGNCEKQGGDKLRLTSRIQICSSFVITMQYIRYYWEKMGFQTTFNYNPPFLNE